MMPRLSAGLLPVLLTTWWATAAVAQHPRLLLEPADVRFIAESLGDSPGFALSLGEKRAELDRYFRTTPVVPVPADPGALSFRNSGRMGRTLVLSDNPENDAAHSMDVKDRTYSWNGYFGLFSEQQEREAQE